MRDETLSYMELGGLRFRVLSAEILETLDSYYEILIRGYYEGLKNEPFYSGGSDFMLGKDARFVLNRSLRGVDKVIPLIRDSEFVDGSKSYSGVVSSFRYTGNSYVDSLSSGSKSMNRRHYYEITLKSVLYRMSLNKSYRIYRGKSILDILKLTMNRYAGHLNKEVDFSHIFNTYPEREYISQYDESDYEFLIRLSHSQGIYIKEDLSRIVFYDSIYHNSGQSSKSSSSGGDSVKLYKYPYNSSPSNSLNSYCVYDITKSFGMSYGSVVSSSMNPLSPLSSGISKSIDYFTPYDESKPSITSKETKHEGRQHHSFTSYDSFQSDAKLLSTLDYLRSNFSNSVFEMKSNIPHLSLNDILELESFDDETYFGPRKNKGNRYKIIGMRHHYVDESEESSRTGTGSTVSSSYSNDLVLQPSDIPFIPCPISKPTVSGVLLGVVTGEGSSERNTIFTDDYGRVQVRLTHNVCQSELDKGGDYGSTCFLRCMTPISSYRSGFTAIPRVGDEVLIGFLRGDCDEPLVVGSLYNAYTPSHIHETLKESYHQTSLSSRTLGAGAMGLNEITLSNEPLREKFYVQAEKDYEELVKHEFTQKVVSNKQSTVGGAYVENIALAHMQNIGLAKNVNVGAEYITVVGASRDTMVGLSNTLNVGVSNMVNVAIDSSENVGKNKTVSIGGSRNEQITKDDNLKVTGNMDIKVQGDYDLTADKEMNIEGHAQISMNAKDNLWLISKKSVSLEGDENAVMKGDNVLHKADSDVTVDAGSSISHKAGEEYKIEVGGTTITVKDGEVTIKAGSVEFKMDSGGFTMSGGKVDVKG